MAILSFDELEKEIIELITRNKFMSLSTCTDNIPTVRMVSIINDGLIIYFMTLKSTTKFQQIKENPQISFCMNNMQTKGTAEISCHPLDNPFFVENYERIHEKTFQIYGNAQDSIIIQVKPELISLWKYSIELGPYKDYLDIVHHEAYRKFYSIEP